MKILILLFPILIGCSSSNQIHDSGFIPKIENPAFTAQIAGMKIGINSSAAEYNLQFTLNIMHWLTGIL